jgi:indole-3-glycerol phosphate synthase
MNILDKIVLNKRKEVEADKRKTSIAKLEAYPLFSRETYSFRDFLLDPKRHHPKASSTTG